MAPEDEDVDEPNQEEWEAYERNRDEALCDELPPWPQTSEE